MTDLKSALELAKRHEHDEIPSIQKLARVLLAEHERAEKTEQELKHAYECAGCPDCAGVIAPGKVIIQLRAQLDRAVGVLKEYGDEDLYGDDFSPGPHRARAALKELEEK